MITLTEKPGVIIVEEQAGKYRGILCKKTTPETKGVLERNYPTKEQALSLILAGTQETLSLNTGEQTQQEGGKDPEQAVSGNKPAEVFYKVLKNEGIKPETVTHAYLYRNGTWN